MPSQHRTHRNWAFRLAMQRGLRACIAPKDSFTGAVPGSVVNGFASIIDAISGGG